MTEAFIRTEDMDPKKVCNYFVETENDREIIELLKGNQPLLLVGSRGTGKTMLLRMAEQELTAVYEERKILPVFVNLVTCNMYSNNNLLKVLISRTLIALQKALKQHGVLLSGNIFKPIVLVETNPLAERLEKYINEEVELSENSIEINDELIATDVAKLKDFLEAICDEFNINQIVFFFDEACQVFQPNQQRLFFDFFRALRSYNVVCNAAVYPGIVTYGSFQKLHDATIRKIERSISSADYIEKMRQIVEKHYPNDYVRFKEQGELLDSVIYASSGNPRFLLKSINEVIAVGNKFNTKNVNDIIKEFYGATIWTEHTKLGEIYLGHRDMIDWSRNFIEDKVLEDIVKINIEKEDKTVYFAISRRAPEVVKQAIKTLEYSGIISLHTEGTKFRTEMYDRYEVNLGVVLLKEKQVAIQKRIKEIANKISVKVFPNYGANSPQYGDYSGLKDIADVESDYSTIIEKRMKEDISILDISSSLVNRLRGAGIQVVGDIFNISEEDLQKIKYIGVVRSRKISNEVYNSVLEYISG